MKSRALACLAALSLLAAPAAVQAAKPGEVELQIEATAQVPPDRAVVPITITGSGETEATAREDLRKKEDNLMAALSAKGIDAAKVKVEGADGSKDGLTVRASDADAACAGAAAAAAAADAQEAAAAAPKKHKAAAREVDFSNCDALTYQTASKTLLVNTHASTPAAPPVASAPTLRPRMPESNLAPIGTAKNKNTARSVHWNPAPPPLDLCLPSAGAGRLSPVTSAII